jgi:hypothetical protein
MPRLSSANRTGRLSRTRSRSLFRQGVMVPGTRIVMHGQLPELVMSRSARAMHSMPVFPRCHPACGAGSCCHPAAAKVKGPSAMPAIRPLSCYFLVAGKGTYDLWVMRHTTRVFGVSGGLVHLTDQDAAWGGPSPWPRRVSRVSHCLVGESASSARVTGPVRLRSAPRRQPRQQAVCHR